jgi:TRAP-type C4-dicarboxylate transport system permease small subunit
VIPVGITNIILLIAGLIVTLFGVGAFFNPNLSRWINAPGGPRLKALIALIIGVMLIMLSFIIKFYNKDIRYLRRKNERKNPLFTHSSTTHNGFYIDRLY